MKISKNQVIESLLKEPLMAGSFIRGDGGDLKTCEVCAVGAVVRNLFFNNKEVDFDKFDDLCGIVTKENFIGGNVQNLLEEGNYLGALSNFFENIQDTDRTVTNKNRERLINFVKENFPEEIEINEQEVE